MVNRRTKHLLAYEWVHLSDSMENFGGRAILLPLESRTRISFSTYPSRTPAPALCTLHFTFLLTSQIEKEVLT